MSHTAELIAVGTEILLGNIANTDAQMLSEELAALGVNVLYHTVVGDNPTRLAEALELARRRVDIVITTGGLGPTYDDLTKQTICTVFGRKNVFHPEIADALRTHFASIGRELTENNLQQAYLPENCTIFRNHNGTAPGCGFCEGGVHVLMLPGPPHECHKMFRTGAIPYLRTLSDEIIVSHSLRIYGQGESQIEAMLHDRIVSMVNPSVAPYAKPDECMLRVTAKAKSEAEAEEMLRGAIEEVMPVIGEWVYGIDVGSLEEVVSALLREKGRTLAAAESCTGGLIAKRMTDLPGASQVFMGGVVSYTNFVKANVLGVPQALLDEHGAVSEPVACAASFLALSAVLLYAQYGAFYTMRPGFLGFLFCGLLWGLSLIVPGMTSSSILMAVGLFTPMAEGFARLDMAVILPWLLGMALIVLTLARVVNWCFRAHYPLFYHAVFGIVLASTVVIIPLHYDGARDALLCLLAAALGALAAYLSAKLQPKEDA